MTASRVTSLAVEVLRAPIQTKSRVTSLAVEVIRVDSGAPIVTSVRQPVVVVCSG